jgi:uncharacterized protein YhfF
MSNSASTSDFSKLPVAEFAFPGPLRDRLVRAILDGRKTTTTGLALAYQVEQASLPKLGEQFVVIDSNGLPVAVIEETNVKVVPLSEVDLAHVMDEGEGHSTIASWRAAHENFWRSDEMLAILDDPAFTVDDETPVVLERFKLVERLH